MNVARAIVLAALVGLAGCSYSRVELPAAVAMEAPTAKRLVERFLFEQPRNYRAAMVHFSDTYVEYSSQRSNRIRRIYYDSIEKIQLSKRHKVFSLHKLYVVQIFDADNIQLSKLFSYSEAKSKQFIASLLALKKAPPKRPSKSKIGVQS